VFKNLAARDLFIVALIVGVWTAGRRFTPADGAVFWALSIVGGLGFGIIGFLIHEWGHLAGSLLSRSVVFPAPRLSEALLFHFDSERNDRRQFLWMSMGGYAATAAWIAIAFAIADRSRWSDRIGLGIVSFGFFATFITEVPMTVRVWRGAPLPMGKAFSKYS
jgi:hypothetical protein